MSDELRKMVDLHREIYQKDGAVSICTHDGQAHVDDIVALCLSAWMFPEAYINRTRKEHVIEDHLQKDGGILIDVGEVYDPSKLAFDHHQNGELEASFVLFAEHFLGPRWVEDAAHTYKWWNAVSIADCRGIHAAAELTSLTSVANPPVGSVLRAKISSCDVIEPGSMLHRMMQMIGEGIVEHLYELRKQRDAIIAASEIETMQIHENDIDILAGHQPGGNPSVRILKGDVAGSPMAYQLVQRQCPYEISITRQSDGEWHVWRDQSLEQEFSLTRCQNLPGCTFAHSQGFLAGFKNERDAVRAVVGLGYELTGQMTAEEFIQRVS